ASQQESANEEIDYHQLTKQIEEAADAGDREMLSCHLATLKKEVDAIAQDKMRNPLPVRGAVDGLSRSLILKAARGRNRRWERPEVADALDSAIGALQPLLGTLETLYTDRQRDDAEAKPKPEERFLKMEPHSRLLKFLSRRAGVVDSEE